MTDDLDELENHHLVQASEWLRHRVALVIAEVRRLRAMLRDTSHTIMRDVDDEIRYLAAMPLAEAVDAVAEKPLPWSSEEHAKVSAALAAYRKARQP